MDFGNIDFFLIFENKTEAVVIERVIGMNPDGPADEFTRCRIIPCLVSNKAKQMHGIAMVLIYLQYFFINSPGLVYLPRLMKLECLFKLHMNVKPLPVFKGIHSYPALVLFIS